MANYGEAFGRSVYPNIGNYQPGPWQGYTPGPQATGHKRLEHKEHTEIAPHNQQHRYDITIDKAYKGETIPAILIVDSAQRNRDMYENPGSYTLDLPKIYTDVISVELMQANIPHSSYTVSSRNNTLTFRFDDTDGGAALNTITASTTTLVTGNYTATTLATELARAMNSVNILRTAPDATFSVTYDPIIQRFKITGPSKRVNGTTTQAHKTFQFVSGVKYGADSIIGLGVSSVNSSANTGQGDTLTLPYNATMRPDRYIILSIDGMNRCDGNSAALANSFCVIPVDFSTSDGDFTLKNGDTIDNDTYIYHYTEPLPKLAKLRISFYAPDGSIYDFNGRDHFLVFEITCLSRPSKI